MNTTDTPDIYLVRERGPRKPGESREAYIKRIVTGAPRPGPEELARLVALLRSGRGGR